MTKQQIQAIETARREIKFLSAAAAEVVLHGEKSQKRGGAMFDRLAMLDTMADNLAERGLRALEVLAHVG